MNQENPMKFGTVFTFALVTSLIAFVSSSEAARMDRRQRHQGARINQGVRSGNLTKEEAHGLRSEQRKIRREKREARADGVVTQEERKEIRQDQKAASQEIYQQKHDDQKAPQ